MLGFFAGLAKTRQEITIETPTSEPAPEGHYVLLQKDNTGVVEGDEQQLHVQEFWAFGQYEDMVEGKEGFNLGQN